MLTLLASTFTVTGDAFLQDEFKFFMDDAKSKLLLVPTEGNQVAEKAATDLNVPVASFALSRSGGRRPAVVASLSVGQANLLHMQPTLLLTHAAQA